jgi:hypothetical protein
VVAEREAVRVSGRESEIGMTTRDLGELKQMIRYSRAMIEFIQENREHDPVKADAAIERECRTISHCERAIERIRYEALCEGCAR